ncbi:MAG: hypothetical protein ABIQ02_05450 [Saprospiraceae bacterium]
MKYLSAFTIIFVFISCTHDVTMQKRIQSGVESYLKAHGQTGEGYKFVAITELDTVTEKDFLDRQMETVSLALSNKNGRLQKLDSIEAVFKKSLAQNPGDETLMTSINDITRSKTELYVRQHLLDSLAAMMKPELSDIVRFIGMNYAFKANDSKGAPVLHHYYVKMDQQLNVLSVDNLQN